MTTAASSKSDVNLLNRLLAVARDIKLSHSVFALPFSLLAMCLAAGSQNRLPSAAEVGLIVLCMVFARTVAMAINRWADAKLDAKNPRTQSRAIPAGRVSRPFVLGVAITCALLFIASTGGFYLLIANPWPIILSPLVLAYLALYSFTKRFTFFCHLVLGTALAISPVAATIAIAPGYLTAAAPWLLFANVACWVAGFDIIYALQDVQVDRAQGLFSLPARLGESPALWISRLLHVGAAASLILLGALSTQLSTLFLGAASLTVGLLIAEHALVWGNKLQHLKVAFGTINGIISLMLGAAGIIDAVRHIH